MAENVPERTRETPSDTKRMLEFKKVNKEYRGFEDFMRIYLDSFPANEIIGIEILMVLVSAGFMRLEAIEENGRVVGMHLTSRNTPVTFIGFLAVDPDLRGRGYGGQILDMLMSEGKPTFLNVEPPDVSSSNNQQRIDRIRFYEKHGLRLTDYNIDFGSGIFRIMTDRIDCLDMYKESIKTMGFEWPVTKSTQ